MHFKDQWRQILEQIQRLKQLDKHCCAIGARRHEYKFNPCIEESQLSQLENEYGFRLSEEIKYVYTTLGNGGVGPDWGLFKVDDWEFRRPSEPWSGVETDYDNEHEHAGMIYLMHRYPSYDTCLICNGERFGQTAGYDCGNIVTNPRQNLAAEYVSWLDETLVPFEKMVELIKNGETIDEIFDFFNEAKLGHPPFAGQRLIRMVGSVLDYEMDLDDSFYRRISQQLARELDAPLKRYRSTLSI